MSVVWKQRGGQSMNVAWSLYEESVQLLRDMVALSDSARRDVDEAGATAGELELGVLVGRYAALSEALMARVRDVLTRVDAPVHD